MKASEAHEQYARELRIPIDELTREQKAMAILGYVVDEKHIAFDIVQTPLTAPIDIQSGDEVMMTVTLPQKIVAIIRDGETIWTDKNEEGE